MKIEDSFDLGVYVHSLVDIEREKIIVKNRLYDVLGHGSTTSNALKALEDQVVYSRIPDWNKYIDYLNTCLPKECDLATEEVVKKWHRNLQLFFAQEASWKQFQLFAERLFGRVPSSDFEVKKKMEEIIHLPNIMAIIRSTEEEIINKLAIK